MPTASKSGARGKAVGRVFTSLLAFVLLAVCSGLIASALFLPGASALKSSVDTGTDMLDKLPVALQEKPLAKISTFLYADGSVMAKFYEQDRIEVPYSAISPNMVNAQIAIEDERFYTHHGVDAQGILRAAVKNAGSGGDIQAGGSTITQQFVKNTLIQNAVAANDQTALREATEGTLARKIKEARLAMAVEKKYPKSQIVTKYLNIAQFGQSSYGVEAAARHFFSTSAKKLTVAQAATLAGMVQSPNQLDPTVNPDKSEKRRNEVLGNMYRLAMITKDQYDQAKATPMASMLKITNTPVGCETAGRDAYFCDYAERVILNSPVFGKTEQDRHNLLYRGGVTFTTTLDKNTNRLAWKALTSKIPLKDRSGVRNALAAVEPGTGKIRAMAQDTEYKLGSKVKYYQTSINYAADKTYGGSNGFQPGSTFKPYALAEWLNTGHGLNQTVNAVPVQPAGLWRASCLEGGNLWNNNWTVIGERAQMPVIRAVYTSSNSGFAAIERQLDLCAVADMAHKFGIQRADGGEWQILPSQVLGTNNVSPLMQAAGFAGFAARGKYCKPIAFTAAVDADQHAVDIPEQDCKQVIPQSTADGVNYALQAVMTRGTGTQMQIGRPAGGKTGTTEDNVHVWFVGFTPQLSTAVWSGNPKVNKPIRGVTIGGQTYARAYGYLLPGPVWRQFMSNALADVPAQGFNTPPSQVLYGPKTTTPSVIGMSPADAQKVLEAKGFPVSLAKDQVFDPSVPAGMVAKQNPDANSSSYQGTPVELTLSKGPDPKDKEEAKPPADNGASSNDTNANQDANQDNNGNDNGNRGNGNDDH